MSENFSHIKKGLYIVPTPIGNLADITLRALEILKNSRSIVALGKIAFDSILKYYDENYSKFTKKPKFKHGEVFTMPDMKKLIACYHPSPRNVNTGRLNKKMMTDLLTKIV